MQNQNIILPTPDQLSKNTTNLTHQDGNGVLGQADVIVKYQIPVGVALIIGGAKDKQKFYYHKANTSVPAVIQGSLSLYKVTPDAEFQKTKIGSFHTQRTGADESDQNKLVDIGKEVAKTLRAFEWLFITFKPDTAATYDAGESAFRLDITNLISVNPTA